MADTKSEPLCAVEGCGLPEGKAIHQYHPYAHKFVQPEAAASVPSDNQVARENKDGGTACAASGLPSPSSRVGLPSANSLALVASSDDRIPCPGQPATKCDCPFDEIFPDQNNVRDGICIGCGFPRAEPASRQPEAAASVPSAGHQIKSPRFCPDCGKEEIEQEFHLCVTEPSSIPKAQIPDWISTGSKGWAELSSHPGQPASTWSEILHEYAKWCASFDDTPRRPTMYAKMCWWHDKAKALHEAEPARQPDQPFMSADDFLSDYAECLRIRDGDHRREICKFAEAYLRAALEHKGQPGKGSK